MNDHLEEIQEQENFNRDLNPGARLYRKGMILN
jgi:hypothetical protein